MKFIQLLTIDHSRIILNPAHILSVETSISYCKERSIVTTITGQKLTVIQTVEQIEALIHPKL